MEAINHPEHYGSDFGIECIDVVENMNFNLGNAIKYIWRCDSKQNAKQDLQKAVWYLNREIKRRQESSDLKKVEAALCMKWKNDPKFFCEVCGKCLSQNSLDIHVCQPV